MQHPICSTGFGVAGLLHIFIPGEKIMDYLGASVGKFRSVVNASIALGLALDFLYLEKGIETTAIAGCVSEVLPQEVKLLFAIFMLLAMTYAMYHAMRE